MNQRFILYGVQGTGNGHISRARLMAAEFEKLGVDVDFLFTGRAEHRYFDMESFARKRYGTGLSFVTSQGRIDRFKTIRHNHPIRFVREVASLRTDRYDLVISDFEPTVAWAARLRKTPTLALGHQYALDANAPQPQGGLLAKGLIKHFAPAQNCAGFHWHPYSDATLPPMIDTSLTPLRSGQGFTLVYLPFENLNDTVSLLQQVRGEHFVLYSPVVSRETQRRNVSIYPLSEPGFRHHLQRCSHVVCNTGFELIAEALHLGIPILTRPLSGQYEQVANAMTLNQLKLATVTNHLGILSLEKFLHTAHDRERIIYPNVASELAKFCVQQMTDGSPPTHQQHGNETENRHTTKPDDSLKAMASHLWSQVSKEAAYEHASEKTVLALEPPFGRAAA